MDIFYGVVVVCGYFYCMVVILLGFDENLIMYCKCVWLVVMVFIGLFVAGYLMFY